MLGIHACLVFYTWTSSAHLHRLCILRMFSIFFQSILPTKGQEISNIFVSLVDFVWRPFKWSCRAHSALCCFRPKRNIVIGSFRSWPSNLRPFWLQGIIWKMCKFDMNPKIPLTARNRRLDQGQYRVRNAMLQMRKRRYFALYDSTLDCWTPAFVNVYLYWQKQYSDASVRSLEIGHWG